MRPGCVSPAWVQWTQALVAALVGSASFALHAMEDDLTPLFPAWEPTITVKAGAGYKDNVTLARKNAESSPFAHVAIEAGLLRLPVDGTQFTLFLIGEDTRYWNAPSVDHENLAMLQMEARRVWANDWEAAFGLEGFYLDQVVDFSITDTNREALPVRGGGMTARPLARRHLSAEVWLSLELPATRQWYEEAVDDYWELGPRISLGRTYGNKSEVSAGYAFTHRGYDEAPAREADGGVLTNTVRAASLQDVFAVWKHHWDAGRHWRSTTRLGYRHSADNASGYFDYERYEVFHQLRWQSGRWELSAEARLSCYRFPVQTVSEEDPHRRRRTDVRFTARAERQMARHVRLYAQFEHERTRSNDPFDEYAVNTVGGGLSFEF
jgi:hypothetical protein